MALKTNWQTNEAVMPENINELAQEVTTLTTTVVAHTTDYNNPHQVTKAQIGLGNVENVDPYTIPMLESDKNKAKERAKKDLSNVSDTDFIAKANEANLPGSDVIPNNLTRLNITVTSYNNLNFEGRTFKITAGEIVYDDPNVYITDSLGHLYIEIPKGDFDIEITNTPGQYNKPAKKSYISQGGDTIDINFLLEKRIDLAVNFILNINQANSNPATCCSYGGNLAGATPSTFNGNTFVDNGWSDRWPYVVDKPCIIKNNNGTPSIMCYLNPNDYTKDEAGTDVSAYINGSSDTSTITYDVMMERNKTYYDISIASDVLKFTLNTNANGTNNFYFPFRYRGKYYEKHYIGCYLGSVKNNKLRSISNINPTTNTLSGFRLAAQRNGNGYENMLYTHYVWEQFLYTYRFANLDSETTCGKPVTVDTSSKICGRFDKSGLNAKSSSGNKVNGIENLWSVTHVEGIEKKRVGNVGSIGGKQWIRIQDYPSNTSDVEQDNFFWSYGVNNFMRRSVCTSSNIYTGTSTSGNQRNTYRAPFFPSFDSGGSSTTYYCDSGWSYETNDLQYATIGDASPSASNGTGIYGIRVYYGNNTAAYFGRLTYCKNL